MEYNVIGVKEGDNPDISSVDLNSIDFSDRSAVGSQLDEKSNVVDRNKKSPKPTS